MTSFFKWFFQAGYAQGVFWANLMSIFSVINDSLMCHLGNRLPVCEVTFFRFFLSTLVLFPFLVKRKITLKIDSYKMHGFRILLGAVALWLCCYSVTCMPLSQNTAIMFTEPLFFLPLAGILLKEKVGLARWVATLIGFIGLVYIIQPGSDTFSYSSLIPMISAILFALLDVVTKKIVEKESTLSLLLTFGIGTSLLTLPFTVLFWTTPSMEEFFFLTLLGIGSNMIQVCLFLAFRAADASALAPFRYVELIFSALFGFIIFSQKPTQTILVGSIIIILSTVYLTYMEKRRNRA